MADIFKTLGLTKEEILNDYKLANISRQVSLLGRKEVLTGKAKFGIFGDGKEIPQLAMAKQFKHGDWRSGYYRDQTFMFATGMSTPFEFFAQLYGDTKIENNPSNAGRSFNNHWGTRIIDANGGWIDQTNSKNTAADLSPTAGQMPRLIGLAYASKLYRNNPELRNLSRFSKNGDEVAFGTIGDASTSEGHFFETVNAAGVLQIPLAISVWDDGYGISVSKKFQTTKESISELLSGFNPTKEKPGVQIYQAKGWDYPSLVAIYREGVENCRQNHQPVLFHIDEITQPQGHSTSGSHERYKSTERLEWEKEFDGIVQMRKWILQKKIANPLELDNLEKQAEQIAKEAKTKAWKLYTAPIISEKEKLLHIIDKRTCQCKREGIDKVALHAAELRNIAFPIRKDTVSTAKKILRHICSDCSIRKDLQSELSLWLKQIHEENQDRYSTFLYNDYEKSALKVMPVSAVFSENSPFVNGREILRDNYQVLFQKEPRLLIFGEDTGKIGGVNQTLEGLQSKYGELRITDTGIRETTIVGQGIGLALRGLRPIAEIQYFDYILYGLQTLSDDLASLSWRTKGGQIAPLIISTRGHRLEGIWHSGSPLSMVINSIRGIYVCTPRNMTQAAGMYNTLLEGEDPALVIEPLNGYRLKERRPDNLGIFRVPLGKPEILHEGTDVTLVTYGSCVRIAQDAVEQLAEFHISVELIDVQTLLPFDLEHVIADSVMKTGRVVFFDEDVPGGATAYMMKKVLEDQKAFFYLDAAPKTLTAKEHRPAYGTDGDYVSNPNAEDVFDSIYELMNETNPRKYPKLY
ncbi:MAG TPA: transketolase [Marinilabiliales bacterium]|nr:MAG: transketolase [Bacteroidetes bacterium GWA2_40_14]OFX61894.1 MAG: transketolase [Bacteroidetes bacterium GWC2_40_13]OFX74041.1 MAG: transketolase [Bacteroidetes bacterium GWD2_40_43]OFX93124.1 MAG: transketolase [Bacteroidetes bacterium GWE2_40_63]OFY21494.1 MAG: transketolase [Bacteroidetes bacterium GWF2_40_13]OFZ24149.1 MAG: transketolase [Bacteroidetes bacterium RIFOXYC2_FULL_40_12]HAM98112.1 transketolase [Marinilabiliales bacterium]